MVHTECQARSLDSVCGQQGWGSWAQKKESKLTLIYILKSPWQQSESSTSMKENKKRGRKTSKETPAMVQMIEDLK